MSALTDSTNTINAETAVEKVLVEEANVEKTASVEAVSDDTTAEKPASADSSIAVAVEERVESVVEEVAQAEVSTAEPEAAVEESSKETTTNDAPVEEVKPEAEKEISTEETVENAESVVEETNEQKQNKLDEHLVSGRRFFKTSNFDKATEMLSVAARLSNELFGDGHENAFEATFLYGQALLELAKIEDEVLTNALTDIPKTREGEGEVQDDVVENPEDVPQEERAEIKKKVEEALGVASEEPIVEETVETDTVEPQEDNIVVEETDDGNVEETTAGEQETAEDVEMEVEAQEGEEGPDQEESDEDAEDEEEPMKLAWEILETARCICDKKIKSLEAEEKSDAELLKKWALNHADVLTWLGEHSVVESKYEQARKDLFAALEIQAAHLSTTSRLLANTNHLLGKAYMGEARFESAATHYSNAKNILIAKTEELKKQLEEATEESKGEIESEIKELEEVIPELEIFITDARASEEQTIKIKEIAKKELASAVEALKKIEQEKTNDITNLVRRPTKRPAEAEPTEEAKKRKSEDGTTAVPDETAMEGTEAVAMEGTEATSTEVTETVSTEGTEPTAMEGTEETAVSALPVE